MYEKMLTLTPHLCFLLTHMILVIAGLSFKMLFMPVLCLMMHIYHVSL